MPLVTAWLTGFLHETGLREDDHKARARRIIGDGVLYLWEDGEPRSMVAAGGPTTNGIRIGYVYTPPPFRGHGYASVMVAHLTQRLLDDGRRFCFLYTDLANPTSNAIYRRLGYMPVSDVVDVVFAEP